MIRDVYHGGRFSFFYYKGYWITRLNSPWTDLIWYVSAQYPSFERRTWPIMMDFCSTSFSCTFYVNNYLVMVREKFTLNAAPFTYYLFNKRKKLFKNRHLDEIGNWPILHKSKLFRLVIFKYNISQKNNNKKVIILFFYYIFKIKKKK